MTFVIVDSHAHAIADDEGRYPLIPGTHDDGAWYRTVPAKAAELLSLMELAGVDRTVLVQPIRAYGSDNQYVADSCRAHFSRFSGVGVVDLDDDDPASRMRDLVQVGGLAGIRLNLAVREDAIDPGFDPLMECAKDLGIPILLRVTPKLLPALPNVIARFPTVAIVLDHCGFAALDDGPPWTAASALFELGAHENLYVKVSSLNLYDAAKATDPAVLVRDLGACFGADHLVWGSDYPHTHDRNYGQLLEFAKDAARLLPGDGAENFLGEVAAELWPPRAGR